MRRFGSGLALTAVVALSPVVPAMAQEPTVTIDNTSPVVGQTLTAQPQALPPNVEFRWLSCASTDEPGCVPIEDAAAASYVVQPSDAGRRLAVSAQQGGISAQSALTDVVREPPTVSEPTISGQAIVGQTLTANVSVTGVPTPALGYEWRRCTAGAPPEGCVSVGNAKDYAVVEADAGEGLIVRATATNSAGEDSSGWTASPAVQAPPAIASVTTTGQAVVGEKLTASADATGTPAPGLTYQWLRCAALLPLACKPIEDATAKGYVVASADVGARLAVVVTAANSAGSDARSSEPTKVVPPPARFDQSGGSSPTGSAPTGNSPAGSFPPATESAPSDATALRYLRPFPVVRVKGFLVPGGARFSLVRVKAPRGSKITVRCRKHRCALPRRALRVGRIRALERRFPAGTKITIRVRKPGLIGKYVRIVIRDGSPPKRRDACLLPGGTRPVACPAA